MGLFKNGSEKKEDHGTNFQVPLASADMVALAKEEMDGIPLKFDRAKVATVSIEASMGVTEEKVGTASEVSGEECVFEVMEGETGVISFKDMLVGVIVDKHPMNVYYADKYNGLTVAPDCCSMDGLTGVGMPGGSCADCPMNRFGTAVDNEGNRTNGKACQNKYRLYLYQEDLTLLQVELPVSSRRNFEGYMTKHIVVQGRRSSGVVTRITLRQAQNKEGKMYAQAQFAVEAVLDEITATQMAEYSGRLGALTRQLPVQVKDGAMTMLE